MEYIIIETKGIEECIKLVNVHLADGWIPSGGVTINGGNYVQALLRFERLPERDSIENERSK